MVLTVSKETPILCGFLGFFFFLLKRGNVTPTSHKDVIPLPPKPEPGVHRKALAELWPCPWPECPGHPPWRPSVKGTVCSFAWVNGAGPRWSWRLTGRCLLGVSSGSTAGPLPRPPRGPVLPALAEPAPQEVLNPHELLQPDCFPRCFCFDVS